MPDDIFISGNDSAFTLGLFDNSAVSNWVDPVPSRATELPDAEADDAEETEAIDDNPVVAPPVARGSNFHLDGDRALAHGWAARARDNIAAIDLSKELEQSGRPPTPDEQAQMLRFIGFGATELAQNCFRRPGETEFRPEWHDLGSKLAYCSFEAGDPAQGLEYLEWAQGVELRQALSPGLTQTLNLNVADRQGIERTQNRIQRLQFELTDVVVGQAQTRRTAARIADDIRNARGALAKMLSDAGVTIGSAGRLQLADILDLAPAGGVLVVPIVTRAGGMAYVIPHRSVGITAAHIVDLPGLRLDIVDNLVRRWLDAYRAMMSLAETGADRPWAVFAPVLDDTLDRLWDLALSR